MQTNKHTALTMLTGQILFVELARPPRLLLVRAALVYLGFPSQLFFQRMAHAGFVQQAKKRRSTASAWLTQDFMTDLAGNAMALPVLLAIMLSALCSVQFREPTALRRKHACAAYCESLEPGARLEFHVGWSSWTRPPFIGGGENNQLSLLLGLRLKLQKGLQSYMSRAVSGL